MQFSRARRFHVSWLSRYSRLFLKVRCDRLYLVAGHREDGRPGSPPSQRNPNVARHPPRPIDNLKSQSITAWSQVHMPKLKKFFWQTGQGVFPARLLLVDCPTAIRKKFVWKTTDKHFSEAIIDRSLDYGCSALESLFV